MDLSRLLVIRFGENGGGENGMSDRAMDTSGLQSSRNDLYCSGVTCLTSSKYPMMHELWILLFGHHEYSAH